MENNSAKFSYIKIAVILAFLYWIVESLIKFFIFNEKELDLIPTDIRELTMKITVVIFIISFGIWTEISSNKMHNQFEHEKSLIENTKIETFQNAARIFKSENEQYLDSLNIYKSIIETAVDGIATINENGIIKSINKSFLVLFNYKAEEIIGQNISIIMPSLINLDAGKYLNDITEINIHSLVGAGRELIGHKSDFSIFPILISISANSEKETTLYTLITRDLTKQKEDQKKLSDANEESFKNLQKFKSIIETAFDSVSIFNTDGIVQSVNNSFIKLFGYESNEIIGKNINLIMPSPFREEHNTYLNSYLVTGIKNMIGVGREIQGKHKNGTMFPLFMSINDFNENGEKFFTGIIRDLSDQKKYERKLLVAKEVAEIMSEQLSNTNESLVQSISDTDKFQNQMIESSKMASLGAMSSGMAHELNQPLGAILLKSQLIPKLIDTGKFEKVVQVVDDIKNQSIRAKKIMDSLRIFSREDKNTVLEKCDLNRIIIDILTMYTQEFELLSINLEVNFGKDSFIILASYVQIGEILSNLLSNARDAVKEMSLKNISINTYAENKTIVLEVADTGCGISKEHIDNIYEPFFTTKPIGKGTGLGLSLSYSMIKDNGGEIIVNSTKNKGTTFKLIFQSQGETNEQNNTIS
ncbi:MAG: hypothetical protein COA79_00870 [Planctomycetota bacterium]|nr:MAG: hypothetical protein COA79_00870 [Planctomycetota bacterium]